MPNEDPLLLDHHSSSSSTRRKKQRRLLIVVMVLFFTLALAAIISVVAVLKHQIDSESPAKNPTLAALSVCSLSDHPNADCFTILSPLSSSSEINPTQILTLAVRSAIAAITQLTPLPSSTDPETNSTLRTCEAALNETLSQLAAASTTLGVDPVMAVGNLTTEESLTCLDWLEYDYWPTETGIKRFRKSTRYASSSLRILRRADMISETLYPTIKSTLPSLLAGWDSAFTVFLFGNMELTKNSMPNEDPLLLDHHSSSSSSTRRKKRQFIAVLVICFTLILAAIISVLAVLKHHLDSESPALAIRSVCSPYGYLDYNCYTILSPLRTSSEINPTQIFTLAVRSAIAAITQLTPLPSSADPETNSTLRSCEAAFNETLSQLTAASTTLGVDPGAGVGNLTTTVSNFKVKACLDWLEWSSTEAGIKSFGKSTMYASSSFEILRRANMISEMFNPTIKSTLASFLAGWNSTFTVFVFGYKDWNSIITDLICLLEASNLQVP
nr:putative pectinesterase/pectinesterase inhibitor 26 [Ipomoea batatas]